MTVDVIMPQMGESVAEGTILKWLVHEGDRIEKEQPIVAISTDKIDTEVPSPVRGIIKKILYPEGKTLPVQTVIAQIEPVEAKEAVSGIGRTPTLEPTKKVETIKAVTEAEKVEEAEKRYSPLVRRLAKEYNINLEEVKGTGEGGRVTKKDIMDYVASKPGISASPTAEAEKKVLEREILVPVSPKRKITADRMVQSKRTAAHVTTVFEVDMTKVVRYRELNKDAMKREGIHLTYLPFITLAAARALKEHPLLNASWTDEGIVQKYYINIGIAVSLEDGLIVPVIRDADKKDLLQLSKDIQDIAARARNKKLNLEDV
ncbi:MAG: 2-oxo acid dehydrogenase subunit E2, partial [Planctomycetes bacterium]|nr:2-oxo acid dehydrogenase subunit E2 [Planctomycetota bacterium]